MRGVDVQPMNLFSYIQLEQRVPRRHPLRLIRKMVDVALVGMDELLIMPYLNELFGHIYTVFKAMARYGTAAMACCEMRWR